MNYYLFKLRFDTAAHFGGSDSAMSLNSSEDHFCADTLFSALCHTALVLYGTAGADSLCSDVRAGKLLLSDSMPWKGEKLYMPKPYITSQSALDIPERLRKRMKKLAWVDVSTFQSFAASVHGEQIYDPGEEDGVFGIHEEQIKTRIDENVALPYQVGTFRFYADCGLYFIAGCETEEQVKRLSLILQALGLSGIGGRVSTGYGRFTIVETAALHSAQKAEYRWFAQALTASAKRYLLLTTSLPNEQEIDTVLSDDATYQLVRRSGYAHTTAPQAFKKKTQYFLAAGSLLNTRFKGALYAVGASPEDTIYRYSSPVMLGVEL